MSATYITVAADGSVSIWDVKEPEAFVRAMIVKTKLKIPDPYEREDVVAEGMAILVDLASKFKPHMAGYAKAGSFAGYCSQYLPRKIWAAWHNMHPEHLLCTQDDGKKRYIYGEAPASLDEKLEQGIDDGPASLRTVGDFVFARTPGKRLLEGPSPRAERIARARDGADDASRSSLGGGTHQA